MEFGSGWGTILATCQPSGFGVTIQSMNAAVQALGQSIGHPLEWVTVKRLTPQSWDKVKDDILALERASFSEKNVFDEDRMERIFKDPNGINIVVLSEGKMVGFVYSGPVESPQFEDLEQVKNDAHYGEGNTFYWAGLAVNKDYGGRGLARLLFDQLLAEVKKFKCEGGKPVEYISSRAEPGSITTGMYNKLGATVREIPGGYTKTGEDMVYLTARI